MTVGRRLGFGGGAALERVQLVQWSERLESAGVLVLGVLFGLLLVKQLALPGLNFLWMSVGFALLLSGEALRWWALLLLLIALSWSCLPAPWGQKKAERAPRDD